MDALPWRETLTGFLVFMSLLLVALGDTKTVDFFLACDSLQSYRNEIDYDDTVTVKIDGANWPSGRTSCSIHFRSYDRVDDLTYKFTSFQLADPDVTVTFEDRFSLSYDTEAVYKSSRRPSIGSKRKTNTYLRITVERESIHDGSLLSASFDVWNDDLKDDDIIDNIVQNLGAIIGGVAGAIALIVIIIVIVCCCCVAKSKRDRANRPTTFTSTSVPSSTAPASNPTAYPYIAAPPTQGGQYPLYPMHTAGYPAGYPAQTAGPPVPSTGYPAQSIGYPAQPAAYPANMQPPPYSSVVNQGEGAPGNTKVEPSAPVVDSP